jgi:hypothetical protein
VSRLNDRQCGARSAALTQAEPRLLFGLPVELLGHRTLQMVMRYSHLAPEHQASAVERLVRMEEKTGAPADGS